MYMCFTHKDRDAFVTDDSGYVVSARFRPGLSAVADAEWEAWIGWRVARAARVGRWDLALSLELDRLTIFRETRC